LGNERQGDRLGEGEVTLAKGKKVRERTGQIRTT